MSSSRRSRSFIVFAATFGILCLIWWLHHQLFQDFFKPDRPGIVLNFTLLGAVVTFTYPLQLFLKFGPGMVISFAAYAVAGALVYGLLAVLFAKGVRQLGGTYRPERRSKGGITATHLGIVSSSMALSVFFYKGGAIVIAVIISIGAIVADIVAQRMRKAATAAARRGNPGSLSLD